MEFEEIKHWVDSGTYSSSFYSPSNSENINDKRSSIKTCRSDTGFSSLPVEAVFKYLGFKSSSAFIRTIALEHEKLINKRESPDELKDNVFNSLNSILGVKPFPSPLNEIEFGFSIFIESILISVASFVNRKCNKSKNSKIFEIAVKNKFVFNEAECESYKNYGLVSKGRLPNGQADFVIKNNEDKVVIVVESKLNSVDEGFKQLLLYLKIAFRLNGDSKKVFGFSTNTCDWSMVSFDGHEFAVMYRVQVLFPQMEKPEYKEKWKKDYSIIVDLIYSSFLDNLGLDTL